MNWLTWIDKFIEILAKVLGWESQMPAEAPVEAPVVPVIAPVSPVEAPVVVQYDWNKPKDAFHLTRVICDELGLTVDQKNLICACIYQESTFLNSAKCENKKNGVVWSTDWGVCQVNDYFHIGKGKDFPSVDYVLQNPDKVVRWMIGKYQHGQLGQWISYSSGAYKQWLKSTSPMWKLKVS